MYEFVGIANGSGFARFAIGIWASAQPELWGPITPITDAVDTYVLVLAAHFCAMNEPSAAVASSHAWYAMPYRPARNLCFRRSGPTGCARAQTTTSRSR